MSFTRRQALGTFVISAGALATSSLSGCLPKKTSRRASSYFPQSVMTGDPTPHSIVFWSRIDAAEDTRRVKLYLWKKGSTDAYETPTVTTTSAQDGIVKLKLVDLEPNTNYQYQFEYCSKSGDSIAKSTVGTTKTAPAVDSDQPVRFAFASCQDFNGRYFNPYLAILSDPKPFDFFVHLGDYIYETTGDPNFQLTTAGKRTLRFDDHKEAITLYAKNGNQEPLAFQAANSLDNYRQLYREYRRDPLLQQMHERMAMIAIWDDHEFSDDSYGATATYHNGIQEETDTKRKQHAEQAYFEYMPIDRAPYISIKGIEQRAVALNAATDLFPNTQVYRSFEFGKHLSLFLADTRSFRKDHLIPENTTFARSAISSQDISDVEEVFIELAATGQVDVVQDLLLENVYQNLKELEEKIQSVPLTDATKPIFKNALHQQILAELKADHVFNSINNLLYNTQHMLKETLQANTALVNDLTTQNLDALQQALSERATTELKPNPKALSNNSTYTISPTEIAALRSALATTIKTTFSLIKQELKTGTHSISVSFINKCAVQALLSTLETDVFYKPLLERLLLLSEFYLKAGQNNHLFLPDNELETLYDILTLIAIEKSPSTLLDKATDYPEMKKNIIRDLEHGQSLGIVIKAISDFIEKAQQKGHQPTNAIKLLATLKTEIPELILERDSRSAFLKLKENIISVPFAALAHLTPFSEIGSRYLVAKESFDLYALIKLFTSKPLKKLLDELTQATDNSKQHQIAALKSMLGEQQTQQLAYFLNQQRSTWKILGSSISTTPMIADFRSETERKPYTDIDANNKSLDQILAALPDLYKQRFYINVDQWDGYPIEKGILQRLLANTNTVAIAGDIHAAYASTFHSGNKTLIELTAPAISSLELGGMLDQGLDNILKGTSVEGKAGPLKAKYNEMVINAPKVASPSDPLQCSNIQLAETRVQGIVVVEVDKEAMSVEYRMLEANHKDLGYLPTQSFYEQQEALLPLVRKAAFKVTRNDQGSNVLEPI